MTTVTPEPQEIARRLKGLRDALDLSKKDMAAKLGTSEDKVDLYESGTAEIPVSYLFNVAQVFDIDLTVLISGKESHLNNYSLVRKGKGMQVERRQDYDYRSLAYRFVGRKMEPFLVTVPPKEEEELAFTEHPGQEFIYLLSGRLEVVLDQTKHVLEPGDSLYFTSRTSHALRGLNNESAEFLDVII